MIVDVLEKKSRREVAREALAEILASSGGKLLKPEDVVDAAADPDHPLHSEFEWNDSAAAAQHRLTQARTLIRSIPVIYVREERSKNPHEQNPVIRLRKYQSLPSDRKDGGGYRDVEEVIGDGNMLEEMLATAKSEVDSVLRRYGIFEELVTEVRAAMDKVKPRKKKGPK